MNNRRIIINLLAVMVLIFIHLLRPAIGPAQVKSRIIVQSSGSPIINKEIGNALSAVLQEVNKVAAGAGDLSRIEEYCTKDGFNALNELVETTGFFSTIPEYRTQILENLFL